MQLTVTEAFWELFPTARIGLVIARGVDNARAAEQAAALLDAQIAASAAALAGADMAAHPAVAPWRAAYAQFGAKPSKFRSSIESLLRSAQSGRLRSISPLVEARGRPHQADRGDQRCAPGDRDAGQPPAGPA